MLKKVHLLVTVVAVLASWTMAFGQDSLSEQKKAQNKLLAYRAARVDAMRKLSEQINGLRLSSSTTVKDFVTESDKIRADMEAFLSGMREVDKPKYMEDGTCEVAMEVPLAELQATLEREYNTYYKGNKIKIEDIKTLTITNEIKLIKAVGNGAPRPETVTAEMTPIKAGETVGSIAMGDKAKAYWMAHVTGQGRLLAVRAAEVDGMRRLAERIKGVRIDSKTSVQDFVTQSDDIKVDMRTFLKGARQVGVAYHSDELIVEVEMEVTLATVYASLREWGQTHYKGNKVVMTEMQELEVKTEKTIIKETGMGVPREDTLKDVPAKLVAIMNQAAQAPGWIGETKQAVGNGAMDINNPNKAQAKLMAFRAGELDARRKLAEELQGLKISSKTTVQDFVTQNDTIRTAMLTFQQGAHVVEGSEKVMEDGTVQVTVEIELRPLWDMVLYYQKTLSITVN